LQNVCASVLLNISPSDKLCSFVCATTFETKTTVLLRTYKSDNDLDDNRATICDAARATSAATTFFEPVTIGRHGRRYIDGGLGANNPVDQVWNEAQNIWCPDEGDLGGLLKCFVSVGTGNPGTKPIAEGAWTFMSDTLVALATQTETTAELFIQRHKRLHDAKRYFRFNVQQGLQGLGLAEYKREAEIVAVTTGYMGSQEIKSTVRSCALNLKEKQRMYNEVD
jgi:predicted acylesterase/phospholipase RssA